MGSCTRLVRTPILWVADICEVCPFISDVVMTLGSLSFGVCQRSLRDVKLHVGANNFRHCQRGKLNGELKRCLVYMYDD